MIYKKFFEIEDYQYFFIYLNIYNAWPCTNVFYVG